MKLRKAAKQAIDFLEKPWKFGPEGMERVITNLYVALNEEKNMRNVSGYLTDDGKFFTDKKEADAHERMASMNKHIKAYVDNYYNGDPEFIEEILAWEKYRTEVTK